MNGFETVLGTVGGLVLGLGLGIRMGRATIARLERELTHARGLLRHTVLPVLERQAAGIAVESAESASRTVAPEEARAVRLAQALRAHQQDTSLPYSDTVQLSMTELRRG